MASKASPESMPKDESKMMVPPNLSSKSLRGETTGPSLLSSSIVLRVVVVVALVALVVISSNASNSLQKENESLSLYATTPMCDGEGVCGESPTQPTPRTIFSAKSEQQYRQWGVFQARLKQSAADFCSVRYGSSNEKKKPAVILLGDSITEAWLGTNMGGASDRADGVPQVFKESFPSEIYDTLVLAIGGDQVQHLQWRLEQGGELPEAIRADPQATFVLLIGTNNLGSGILPAPTVDGVVQLVESILKTLKGRLVVLKLLPRGDDFRLAPLCPPRCDEDGKPYKSFMPAIRKVNDGLQQRLGSLTEERLQLVDCGKDFEGTTAEEVDGVLMPDKLHPNADGHRKFAACIKKYL